MTLQNQSLVQGDEDTPAPFINSMFLLGAIMLGGLVGLVSPLEGENLSRGFDATLMVMVFLLFFELRLCSVFSAFQNIRFLALAWSANFLIIPAIGFGVASLFFSGQPLLFAGLMIYFLAPCTDWFLGFTRLANGDTELGATLIPINIITQLLLFPFWLWLFANGSGFADLSSLLGMLLQWFLVPLMAAQAIRFAVEQLLPEDWCASILSIVSRYVPFVLAALIFQIFAAHIGEINAELNSAILAATVVCVFFVTTVAAGETLSRLGRLAYPQRALLTMTMAARNAPLMVALTAIAIPNQPLVLAVIVTGMLVEFPLLTALNQLLLKFKPEK